MKNLVNNKNYILLLYSSNYYFPQYTLPSNNFFTGITTKIPYHY